MEQIRTAIAQLERQLAKAQANGDQKAQQQAKEAIEARRSWLAEAERTLAELAECRTPRAKPPGDSSSLLRAAGFARCGSGRKRGLRSAG